MKNKISLRFLILAVVLIWCTGFSLNILISDTAFMAVTTPVLNLFYGNVCHQNDGKLIYINGFCFSVCARCSGIYFGALITSVLMLFLINAKRISSFFLISAAAILACDIIVNNFIIGSYNKPSAFITGLIFGSVCLIILINTIEELFLKQNR